MTFDKGYSYIVDPDFDAVQELTIDDCKNILTQRNTYIPDASLPINYGERALERLAAYD